jgi:tetratricopeptide (TPR) repeat protein
VTCPQQLPLNSCERRNQNCGNALAIRESLAKLDPNDARYKFSLAKNYVSFAKILEKRHQHARAIESYQNALSIQRSLATKDPFNALVARDLADTQHRLHALNALEQPDHL